MDNEQARLILAAYRPDGRDAGDPAVAEALSHAERDPELRDWFSGQRDFDRRMIEALKSVRPPAGGRSRALAAVRVTGRRRVRRAWAWPMAMAASVALIASLTTVVVQRPGRIALPESASIETLAAHLAVHHASIGLMDGDYAKLIDWIEDRGGPVPEALPAALTRMPVIGCEVWRTDRGKVSLLCFVSPDRERMHLYVFEDAASLPGPLPLRGDPHIERHGIWAMAGWQENGKGYVLGIPAEGDAATALAPFFEA